jgi:hypothetical protein
MFGMTNISHCGMLVIVAALSSACAASAPQPMLFPGAAAPPRDQLYQADRVLVAHLADTPDGTRLAPVLTERSAYSRPGASPVRFRTLPVGSSRDCKTPRHACQPGALDGYSGSVTRYRSSVVICSTAFLDGQDRVVRRMPINDYRHQGIWRMQDPNPPLAPVR